MKRLSMILMAAAALGLAGCSTPPDYVPVNTASSYGTAAPGVPAYTPPEGYGAGQPYYPYYDQYGEPSDIYAPPEVETPYYYYGAPDYYSEPYYPYYGGFFGGPFFVPSFRGHHDFDHGHGFQHGGHAVTPGRGLGSPPVVNHGWSGGRARPVSPAGRAPQFHAPAMHAAPAFHGPVNHGGGGAGRVSGSSHSSGGRR